jgi:outer membrane receptor protein involved in Fe transport
VKAQHISLSVVSTTKSHKNTFMLKRFTLLFFLGLILTSLMAENAMFVINGVVMDSVRQQPIEFATVVAKNTETDQVVTGTTTASDGSFELRIRASGVYLEVSFIGFSSKKITDLGNQKGKTDLGPILLSEQVSTLDEVEVRAERSQTVFRLDKRIFNVGQDLSSAGASALEVLNNVPSVNVNIEGEVSLRGSNGVQILINGKPSVMASEEGGALGTITADMIQQVEVITNPSAKYEAEGSSGIINIVLKKDERKGLNGSLSLNTGIPDNHSMGLSLNRRTEKFNLFSQLGVGYRSLPRVTENINEDRKGGSTITSDGIEYRNETFFNIILGADYYIDKRNVLTLSGNFAYEIEDQPSRTNFSQSDAEGNLISQWFREEVTSATNPKYSYEFNYKREFKDDKDHTFIFSALGNLFQKSLSSDFTNQTIMGANNDLNQRTETAFGELRYTFKADYTKPFSNKWKMEAGGQYDIQDVSNDFAVSDFLDNKWVVDPNFTNLFEYDQKVLGVYTTGSYEGNKWGLMAGLRAENTNLQTLLANTGERNNQNFTNLFPSFHTSYKLSEFLSFQAGYSRRIRRPRLWDLNPFFNIRNNFSIRTGNPELLPEFTDSWELNSIFIFPKVTMNFGLYHRFTTDVIERVSSFENNVNTFKPINIGTNNATGIEFNGKYSPAKWLSFNGDFNFNYFSRNGTFEGAVFDFDASLWTSKLMSKLKLPADFDLEITGQYRSAIQTVQGRQSANLFADMGLRKKLFKGKAVLNFSVRDIFISRFRENIIDQEDFFLYSYGRRGRFFTFGFSYGFGKGEAMQYSGKRR